MVENRTKFLQFLEDLKPYLVKFDFERRIKEKIYLLGYKIEGKNWQPVICIIYDKYIFSANDRKRYIWQIVEDTIL